MCACVVLLSLCHRLLTAFNLQTIIIAAADTSVVTLTWAIALLLNNRDVLKKAQDELDIQVGTERLVNESDTRNLVYLQSIIKETMRLYPAAPLFYLMSL